MKPLILILFLFCLLRFVPLHSQENLQFQHYTVKDGLTHNSIISISQDQEGFMWFGTEDGLNRYDGYTFKHYKADPKDPQNSLRFNHIFDLFEDSKGRFWIGSSGLQLFNKKNDRFTAFLPDSSRFTYLNISLSILEDKQGNLWYSAGGGLNKFDSENKSFTSYLTSELTPNFGLIEDQIGNFWMGSGAGLYQFSSKTEKFTSFPLNHEAKPFPVIKALLLDTEGVLWIGTAGEGLFQLNTLEASPQALKYNPENLVNNSISNNGMYEDSKGYIWLATSDGLQKIDKKINKVNTYRTNPKIPGSISSNNVFSIYEDKNGTFWVGTDNGINKLLTFEKPFNTFKIGFSTNVTRLDENKINAITEDQEGMVWLGTAKGLYRLDPKNDESILIPLSLPNSKTSSSGDKPKESIIVGVHEDKDGRLWIGVESGLFLLENGTDKVKHFPCDFPINFMETDPLNRIWIAGGDHNSGKAVMAVFDLDNLSFNYTEYDLNDQSGLKDMYMHGFIVSRTGDIWVAAGMWGIGHMNHKSRKYAYYLPNPGSPGSMIENDILCIFEDGQGIIWAGTKIGGIFRFDLKTKKFTNFTTHDGLSSNHIMSINEDSKGNLWIGTSNGLSNLDTKKNTFRNFDTGDGLPDNEFRLNSVYKKDEKLYFGTNNGLLIFNPVSIQNNSSAPPVFIIGLKVLEKKRDLPEDKLELSYDENFISFDFAALDYNAPDNINYAYKLENANEDWIYSGNRRYANYTNLDPGEYNFKVKASNSDGVWNEEGASIKLVIFPPWWRTSWAYLLYGFVAIGLLYSVWKYSINKERMKNDLKLKQLEAEKLQELAVIRANFFSNISHEFRTPLTLILGPLEKLLESCDPKNHSLYQVMEN
jgi:ligand-binding sensor domain-containing protein